MSNYSVKGIKTFTGREGKGFNATLYRDGKKIAMVSDMADGGMLRFDWVDYSAREEDKLDAYCATLPKTDLGYGMRSVDTDKDLFVSRLVEDADIRKKMSSQLRKKTVFIADGVAYTSPSPFSPATRDALLSKFPNAIILNALPADEAERLYFKHVVVG